MKRKVNVVLIILVVSLWGCVIYKYLNQYFVKNNVAIANTNNFNIETNKIVKKDTFEMKEIERDPFLNSTTNKFSNKTNYYRKIISHNLNKFPAKNLNIDFPSINYLGYIKSMNKQNELVLLKVNGKLLKFRINEIKEELSVVKIHKDSIEVKFKNKKKTIKFYK